MEMVFVLLERTIGFKEQYATQGSVGKRLSRVLKPNHDHGYLNLERHLSFHRSFSCCSATH